LAWFLPKGLLCGFADLLIGGFADLLIGGWLGCWWDYSKFPLSTKASKIYFIWM